MKISHIRKVGVQLAKKNIWERIPLVQAFPRSVARMVELSLYFSFG